MVQCLIFLEAYINANLSVEGTLIAREKKTRHWKTRDWKSVGENMAVVGSLF